MNTEYCEFRAGRFWGSEVGPECRIFWRNKTLNHIRFLSGPEPFTDETRSSEMTF